MKIEVYQNLNKDCLSVRSRETHNYGIVVDHVQAIAIKDAEFVVQPAGLEDTKETGVKNVHAFVRGLKVSQEEYKKRYTDKWFKSEPHPVSYNPFYKDYFYLPFSEEEYGIESAPFVYLSIQFGVFVWEHTRLKDT